MGPRPWWAAAGRYGKPLPFRPGGRLRRGPIDPHRFAALVSYIEGGSVRLRSRSQGWMRHPGSAAGGCCLEACQNLQQYQSLWPYRNAESDWSLEPDWRVRGEQSGRSFSAGRRIAVPWPGWSDGAGPARAAGARPAEGRHAQLAGGRAVRGTRPMRNPLARPGRIGFAGGPGRGDLLRPVSASVLASTGGDGFAGPCTGSRPRQRPVKFGLRFSEKAAMPSR